MFSKLSARNHRRGQDGPCPTRRTIRACAPPSSPPSSSPCPRTISSAPSTRRRARTPSNIEEVRYEGYGPGGVALIVETLTDNRNRTGGDVRSTFSKYGGAMGEPNSVTFMFDRMGVMLYPKDKGSDDAMLEAAIDAGFDECVSDEDGHEFLVSFDNYGTARDALEKKLGQPLSARIEWRPKTMTPVSDDNGETLIKLIDVLDDLDDVQNVFGNYELSDALMEKLG